MPNYYPNIYFDMDLYCWMWGIFIEGCNTPKISPIPSKEQAKEIVKTLKGKRIIVVE